MLLHERNILQLSLLLERLPHGLLVVGPKGAGKDIFLDHFKAQLISRGRLCTLTLFDAADTFGIDDIRELWRQLAYKPPKDAQHIRIITIKHAENLRTEAQTALLKTLEEPPSNTILILQTRSSQLLLPTIVSRLQSFEIVQPSLQQYIDTYPLLSQQEIEKAYLITDGWLYRMKAMLDGSDSNEYMGYITQAKGVLTQTLNDRMAIIEDLVKQKTLDIHSLLEALLSICRAAYKGAIERGNGSADTAHIWLDRATQTLLAIDDIQHGGNKKIVLTDLFLKY